MRKHGTSTWKRVGTAAVGVLVLLGAGFLIVLRDSEGWPEGESVEVLLYG
jgi:hypothetical protein